MIVVDASATFEALSSGVRAAAVQRVLANEPDQYAPALADAENGSIAQIHVRRELLDRTAAELLIAGLGDSSGIRLPHPPLLARAWKLRHAVTFYHAPYIAVAEALDSPLFTLDGRLSRSDGPRCEFVVPA